MCLGPWDLHGHILTHTQPLRLRPPVAVFCSPAVLAASFPPLSAPGETVCVSHAPWSDLSTSAVWFPCLPRDLSSLIGWIKVMILCITWLSLIVGLGARCCVLNSALFFSLKWGCPHPPRRAAEREGELLCQAPAPYPMVPPQACLL